MQFRTFTGNPVTSRAHCVVVGVYDKNNLSPSAERLDKTSRGTIKKVLARGDISGAVGQTLLLQDLRGIQAPAYYSWVWVNPEIWIRPDSYPF